MTEGVPAKARPPVGKLFIVVPLRGVKEHLHGMQSSRVDLPAVVQEGRARVSTVRSWPCLPQAIATGTLAIQAAAAWLGQHYWAPNRRSFFLDTRVSPLRKGRFFRGLRPLDNLDRENLSP